MRGTSPLPCPPGIPQSDARRSQDDLFLDVVTDGLQGEASLSRP